MAMLRTERGEGLADPECEKSPRGRGSSQARVVPPAAPPTDGTETLLYMLLLKVNTIGRDNG